MARASSSQNFSSGSEPSHFQAAKLSSNFRAFSSWDGKIFRAWIFQFWVCNCFRAVSSRAIFERSNFRAWSSRAIFEQPNFRAFSSRASFEPPIFRACSSNARARNGSLTPLYCIHNLCLNFHCEIATLSHKKTFFPTPFVPTFLILWHSPVHSELG